MNGKERNSVSARDGAGRMGNHNRAWMWGRRAVLETLRAGRWPVFELAVAADVDPDVRSEVDRLARRCDVPVQTLASAEIARRCRAEDHQGLAARLAEYPYLEWDDWKRDLLALANPFALVLDRIHDAFNFGAVARSAEVLGVKHLLVDRLGQCPVNSQAARSSAGAVNHLRIGRVGDLPAALSELSAAGLTIIVASEKAERSIDVERFTGPAVLVVGNEGTGPRPEVLAACTHRVAIRQDGRIDSLNAAVSAGILLHELRRQRETGTP